VLIDRDGTPRAVTRVDIRDADAAAVCRLTIRGHHSLAVGDLALLVHNEGWCDILKLIRNKPDELSRIAKAAGIESRIHAHHLVLKGTFKGARGRFVGQAQEILADYGIPLLDDMGDMKRLAHAGDNLDNMAWAIDSIKQYGVGNGVHSTKYTKAVAEGLQGIVDDGIRKGWSEAKIASDLKSQLGIWREILENGGRFW